MNNISTIHIFQGQYNKIVLFLRLVFKIKMSIVGACTSAQPNRKKLNGHVEKIGSDFAGFCLDIHVYI